jgi:hypothetical protein
MSVSECSRGFYKVKIVHHKNRYASTLYDVDGHELVGESGEKLNVFKEEFKDMLMAKKIRFIHYLGHEPTYAYFVTNSWQLDTFQVERQGGSTTEGKVFHVYTDI